jgi:acyl carrier protein
MLKIATADIIRIVNTHLADAGRAQARSADERLSALGIDSLTTINILLAAAGEFGLDLSRLSADTPIPGVLGDLTTLLASLED